MVFPPPLVKLKVHHQTPLQEENAALAKKLDELDAKNLGEVKGPEGSTDLDGMAARQQSEIEKLRREKQELQDELQVVRLEVSICQTLYCSLDITA